MSLMLTAWRVSWNFGRCWPTTWRSFATQPGGVRWQVSSHGRICTSRGVVSEGYRHATGYRVVQFQGQKWRVHRVVKITFDGLPPNAEAWQVHHLDGDRSNNRLDNLEYVTHRENVCHSYSNPLRATSGPAQSKMVFWRPVGSTSWESSPSATLAAQQLGMSQSTVSRCCANKSLAKGYEFKFQDPYESNLPGEEWRPMLDPMSGMPVPGRMVSSLGRIASKRGVKSRGYLTSAGYYRTQLCINSARSAALVHRLVAFAFLGPPPSVHQKFVNHKDLDKGNNAADNLEWVSCAENHAHFHANATRRYDANGKPVLSRLCGSHDPWTWHPSCARAVQNLALHRSNVSACTRGIQKKTGGYEFRFAEFPKAMRLPGEEWREVDLLKLQRDKEIRRL